MKMTQDELNEIVRRHGLWLKQPPEGNRADLRGADLSHADLRGADLGYADLRGADLGGAELGGAGLDGVKIARCDWTDHGETGRTLVALYLPHCDKTDTTPEQIEGVTYHCGCFYGTEAELREYIATDDERYRKSRTIAVDFCAARMAEMMVTK